MITSPDDLRAVRKAVLRQVFGVGYAAITKWGPEIEDIGADNGDGTFDLIKIVRWRVEKSNGKKTDERANLEEIKLRREIELKESQIKKTNDAYVERTIADQEKIALFRTISNFLEKIPSYRKQQFHMIHSKTAEKRLRKIFKEALDQIADAPVRKK